MDISILILSGLAIIYYVAWVLGGGWLDLALFALCLAADMVSILN